MHCRTEPSTQVILRRGCTSCSLPSSSVKIFNIKSYFTPPRQTRHRQDCFVVSGVAVGIESARPPDKFVLCRSVSGGAVRPPDALRRRKHFSGGQFTPPHRIRQDRRACLSTAAATQARQTATPSRPTAHTQRRCTPRKCKHAA